MFLYLRRCYCDVIFSGGCFKVNWSNIFVSFSPFWVVARINRAVPLLTISWAKVFIMLL